MEKRSPIYVDYKKFLSTVASRRKHPSARKNIKYAFMGDYTNMSGGFPNPDFFPFLETDVKLRDGTVIHVDQKLMTKHLQYGLSQGYPDLRDWLMEFQRRLHSPPTLDPDHPGQFDLIITNGSKEGISLVLALLMSEGDWALCEEATYPSVISWAGPLACSFQGIKADKDGMIPEDLERVLTSWSELHPDCRKPKMLYVVTCGGNPTGITWSLERKQAVYDIARAHDMLIVEDDAYYFLQFNRPLVPSLLSMDVDGRVLRLDTMSKILAPGLRVAAITGPAPLLLNMRWHKDISSSTPSGVSQVEQLRWQTEDVDPTNKKVMVSQLLRHWGFDDFLRHMDSVAEAYKHKAQIALKYAERYLSGLAEWNPPTGGFYLWVRVLGVENSEDVVQEALDRQLIVIAGTSFTPNNEKSAYIRISYGIVSEEECEKAFKILAEAIKATLAKKQ